MKEINDSEFDDFVKSNETVIIDFWADWCGPCKMVAPIFDELSKEFEGKAVFAKMDITENPNTPSKFGVVSIPTFLIFKNGEISGELHGAMSKPDFKARLNELF